MARYTTIIIEKLLLINRVVGARVAYAFTMGDI